MDLNDYSIFRENKETFKETSKDDSDTSHIQYMTDSEMEIVNFDQVKRCYVNALGLSENNAASVDALAQFAEGFAFVEFKNGKVNNRNVKDKIRDSLLMFTDITGESVSNTRNNLDLIVVYNIERNPLPNQLKRGTLQESPSRIAIADHIAKKAKEEIILFDLERYKKLYFRKVHTYSKEKFAEYLTCQEILTPQEV
mgnify:CR=1 FL=1